MESLPVEQVRDLLSFRERFSKIRTEEEQIALTRELLRTYPDRYRPMRKYVEKGNRDIEERLHFLKEHTSGDFIDVGSYDGFFVHELEKYGSRAVGVDVMPEAIDLSRAEQKHYPRSKAEFVRAYADNLPFSDASFETTLLSHTLEHVIDPVVTIKEAARVTKQGGKIIAIVPFELGNEPTHIRIVDASWLEQELKKYGTVESHGLVGEGFAYIVRKE